MLYSGHLIATGSEDSSIKVSTTLRNTSILQLFIYNDIVSVLHTSVVISG